MLKFLSIDEPQIIGTLVESLASTGIETQRSKQIQVWRDEIELLKRSFQVLIERNTETRNWYVILEYDIPRRQKRPDLIVLADDAIIVTEFKLGSSSYEASAKWQVEDYALNLRDFHSESRNRYLIPILCATDAPICMACGCSDNGRLVTDVRCANSNTLAESILGAYEEVHRPTNTPIVPEKWLNSPYRPTLTVIEAAESLYGNHDVREISHSYAANLDQTTDMLTRVIIEAKRKGKHTICFVTGVPGAGKTLTGLNVVHDPTIRSMQGPSGIFLSGNGPLVKVVREALIQNQQRAGRRRRDCEHEVTTFIQNVHQFLRYHRDNSGAVPHEHVVVFDEAQRAWNSAQMRRKQGVEVSEPSLLMEIMERFEDWAVIVALVGGGQEIFLGEAGLEEWGNAILSSSRTWHIVGSPEVIQGGTSVAEHKLFDNGLPPKQVFQSENLAHLKVSVRSHRAQQIAEWVNDVLVPDSDSARQHIPDGREFPIVITRDLDKARDWLRARSQLDPHKRCGLVSTSEDQRLRAYGIENSTAFRLGYSFEKWFLAPPDDVRSSYALEVAASEFECQGLELDYVGVSWGGDLSLDESGQSWIYRNFRGSGWQFCRIPEGQAFIKNRYRVLLTRARLGMVIWVPCGSDADATRPPEMYDSVYQHLKLSGVPDLSDREAA